MQKRAIENIKQKGAASWEEISNLVFDALAELVDAYIKLLAQFSS